LFFDEGEEGGKKAGGLLAGALGEVRRIHSEGNIKNKGVQKEALKTYLPQMEADATPRTGRSKWFNRGFILFCEEKRKMAAQERKKREPMGFALFFC